MAIRPPREDLYEELGVPRNATGDEVNAAFRARAKALHPDTQPGDPAAAEEFKRVSRAYSVLRDPAQRARYDAGVLVVPPASPPDPLPATGRPRFTRRAARWALGAGIVLVVLGVAAAAWVVQLQRDDAALLADGVATQAVVVLVDGERRFEFQTRGGEIVQAVESTKSGTDQPDVGSLVDVRYDRDDPTRIALDVSHTARDVTLWIVAVKFLVGGAVITVLAVRRLGRADAGEA
jgi:hypothetical protein